ncbi:MAG: 3-deoxy-D-manno-octulosonic acid transferase [Nitrospirae bacterium]|nr:MAG: 3-deoxy-D-manno-octulosonic acid transferase [Nitrospirota bacterium]
MWYFLYNGLLLLASPVILAMLLAKPRCRRGLPQRLGLVLPGGVSAGRPLLWVHAVSLGEAVAVAPLVKAFHARYPAYRIIVSTVTETGREAVEQRLAGVADHCYAPLDFPWVVAKMVRHLNPSLFLFVETELWPNLLRQLGRSGIPAVLVNGRLSSRSFGRYRLIRSFLRQVLGAVTACLMQSDRDAERMVALGARPDRVMRIGNIKFDQPLPGEINGPGAISRAVLGLAEGEELIVAGSTHPGEEEELLTAYQTLVREFSKLVLVLAPRHIERAAEVEAAVKGIGLTALRRSLLRASAVTPSLSGPRVLILDTRGELALVYREAVLAYVGGTLVPVGGHNLLEPAVWAKPVFFGPFTDHCAEIATQLSRAEGMVPARNGTELAKAMAQLLRRRADLQKVGLAAQQVVNENRGALRRSLDHIGKVLDTGIGTRGAGVCGPSAGLVRKDALAPLPGERGG